MHFKIKGRVIHLRIASCLRLWKEHKLKGSLITLLIGCCMFILLHIFIVAELKRDEAAYFASLPIPEEPNLLPLGIDRVEDLPLIGTWKIPKRIHQTWKTGQIPQSMVAWITSWMQHHPGWEYWLWTDSSARQLIKERHPSLLPIFDAYPNNIQRADALRYVVLLEFGGVYADMDMESLRPLDPLALRYSCFLGQEPYPHPILDTNSETLVINALIACRQGHPFMKMVVKALPDFAHMWNCLDSTGPHFFSYVYKKYQQAHPQYKSDHINGTYLTPAEYLYPNMDPDKFQHFYERCANYNSLGTLQRRACQSLKTLRPKMGRLALAFTDHHWMHTYLFAKVSLRKPVPIQEIVPSVKIYS